MNWRAQSYGEIFTCNHSCKNEKQQDPNACLILKGAIIEIMQYVEELRGVQKTWKEKLE